MSFWPEGRKGLLSTSAYSGKTRSTRVWAKRSMLPAARSSRWRCRTQSRSSAVFSSGTRVARASPARTSRAMPSESMRSLRFLRICALLWALVCTGLRTTHS